MNISSQNTPKKRKLTFNDEKCCFCLKRFDGNKTVLDSKKVDSLLSVCKNRNDEVAVNIVTYENQIRSKEIKVCYHKACRAKYVHPFYNQLQDKSSLEPIETVSKVTRSKLKDPNFDWKQNCFICGKKCSEKHRSNWSRVEGSVNENSKLFSNLLEIATLKGDSVLHARLLSSKGDLVAVEARYHRRKGCLPRYISERNKEECSVFSDKSKLTQVCRHLKNDLQNSIDGEKNVYELSYLKSRVFELSVAHDIDIGRNLKAKQLKKVLRQVWPGITFIPREGLTDLVCSNSITIEEALSKSVDLEKSFHDVTEKDECESSLCDIFFESNEMSIIHQAAVILRNRILKTEGLCNEYFSSAEISLQEQKTFVDPLLLQFVGWLSCESKLNEGIVNHEYDNEKKLVSICSDITTLVKSVVTPKHLALSIYLHHTYGSKKLIEDLNSHGYTLSYHEVRHFLTSAARYMSSIQEQTPSGAIIPAHLSVDSSQESDRLLVAAADNWDHNENTLSGKHSTHAMTSILVVQSSMKSQTATRIPRVKERSIDSSTLSGCDLSHTLPYTKPFTRPVPVFDPPVQLEELDCAEPDNAKVLRLKEILYNFGRDKIISFCDDRSDCLPPWTVFQAHIQTDLLFDQADVVFNPIIMSPPNDYNTVYTTLKRTKEQMNALGQTVCPIYFDMGLLSKALEIVWANPKEFEGVLPLEGGMHFMMSLFGGIGYIYGDAGLKDLLVESGVFAKLTAGHILSGKDFDRALRACIMIDEVLNRRFYLQFLNWMRNNSKSLPSDLFQLIRNLDIKSEGVEASTNEVLHLIESKILPLIEQFRLEGRETSPLFRFWDDFLNKVSLPIKLFLASSRHAMWDVHQFSKTKLLPFLFASNRTIYSRFMPYIVLEMNRLPVKLSDSFARGLFVSKLSQSPFSSVWYDYVLEVTENKALKSSGGIIGITHNDRALNRWFLARPITAKYAMAYSSNEPDINNINAKKHHTETPFHIQSYNEVVGKMIDMFDETFIDPFSLDNPPARLVNFATGIETTQDVEESLLNCHDTGKDMLFEFVKDRLMHEEGKPPRKKFFDPLKRRNIKTMNSSLSLVKTRSKQIKIDGEEMYLRLLAINTFKKVPLDRVLSFENAPIPLSLFSNDGNMISTKKSYFAVKLENLIGSDSIQRNIKEPDCILFDAMAIIQMLQPITGTKQTYEQMAAAFWRYVLNKSVGISQIHIVFDRYIPNSLKSQTRKKRGENTSNHLQINIKSNMVIPEWKKVLTNSKSKGEITKFYTQYLTENCHVLLDKGKEVVVSGGLDSVALRVMCDMVSLVHEIDSNQEEADTRLLLHLSYSATSGVKSAVVVSPDTDVLVLLVYHFNKLCVDELYFKTGRKSTYSDLTRYIPVHSVAAALSPTEQAILLPIYCLTGCDTCSSFFGIGKKRVFQMMLKHSNNLSGISELGEQLCLSSNAMIAAVNFVGLLYGSKDCKSLNSLRTSMVLGKKNIKPKKLPPTDDSFRLHLLRCLYQMWIWRGALEAHIELPDPLDFGYMIDAETGQFIPQMMNQPIAPPELINDFVCLCSNKCNEDCICSNNEQPCTQACECKGCVEETELCQNLFTMLASIDSNDFD